MLLIELYTLEANHMSKCVELACLVPCVLDMLDTESVFCLSWPTQVFVAAIARVILSRS